MKNMKFWRTALVATLVLTVMLSVTGGTIAWFTDSVTSGNNIIKTGNLDIEVQYTLDGENWEALDTASDLFQKDLWEPGHTEVVALKIENKGSLAAKYIAKMNIVEETVGKTKEGTDIVLSDILTVDTLVQQANIFGDVVVGLAFAGENEVLYENSASFKESNILRDDKPLFPGDGHYMIIKVDMAETVGNEANHNGTDIPSIKFGIELEATQYTHEEDSFGNDYDKDATYPAFVSTAAELVAALEKGGNVTLTGDIEVTNPIGLVLVDGTKLNLAGNKLTANLIVAEGINVTISNGELVNKSDEYSAIESEGNLTLNDVQVASTRHAVRVKGGETVINGGTYKTSAFVGRTQHALNVSGDATVIVNGGTFVGPKGTVSDSGSAVNVQAGSTVTINGGNFSGGKNNTLSTKDNGVLQVKGGTFDQNPSTYVADGYKVVGNGALYVVVPAEDETVQSAATTEELSAAVQSGAKTILLTDGEFELKGNQKDGLTLIGTGNTKLSNLTNFAGNGNLGAIWQNVNFENVIFTEKVYTMEDGAYSSFKNCTFENGIRGAYSRGVTFDGCTFYPNNEGFAMHFSKVYTTVTVDNCKFEKGTIAFGDDGDGLVTFNNCTFSGETTRTEYFDAWASCTLNNCVFNKDTEIWLEQGKNGETVTLNNTTNATVVQK